MIAVSCGMNLVARVVMHQMREMCAPACCEGPSRLLDAYQGRDNGGFYNSEESLGWGNARYRNGEMNNSFNGHNPVAAKIARLQAEMQEIEARDPEAAARAQQWENNPVGIGILGGLGGNHGEGAPQPINQSGILGQIKPDQVTVDTNRLEVLEHEIYQLQHLPQGGML